MIDTFQENGAIGGIGGLGSARCTALNAGSAQAAPASADDVAKLRIQVDSCLRLIKALLSEVKKSPQARENLANTTVSGDT